MPLPSLHSLDRLTCVFVFCEEDVCIAIHLTGTVQCGSCSKYATMDLLSPDYLCKAYGKIHTVIHA